MKVDFQRLSQVRARRSSRRKRWIRGLSTLGAAGVLLTASQVAAPVLPGQLLASLLQHGTQLLGGGVAPAVEHVRGAVEVVEPAKGVIRVSFGFLGLMSVELVVTPETLILVGDKEGGFGDLRDGRHVNAAYEPRPGPQLATRVEVVVDPP